jgi:hypothetical protein
MRETGTISMPFLMLRPLHEQRSPVLHPAVSLVSLGPQGHDNHSARDLVRWHRAGFRCYWCWKATMAGVPQLMLDTGGYPTSANAAQQKPSLIFR